MNIKSLILSKACQFGTSKQYHYALDLRAALNDYNSNFIIEVASSLWNQFKHLKPGVLVGKGIGSYPLMTAIKIIAGQEGINLAVLFIRDQRKNRGYFKKIVEGPDPEKLGTNLSAVFVDDIMHKGKTYIQSKETLKQNGYNLNYIAVAVIYDFFDYSRVLRIIGFPFVSLINRLEIGFTRRDHNLPTILDKPIWHLHEYHTGRDYMPIKSMPVLHQGKLFVGNDNTSFNCFNVEDGTLLWSIKSKLPSLKGTVCVAKFFENNVYFTSYDGTVRSIQLNNGSQNWAVKVDANLHSAVAIDEKHRRLFVGTEWDKQTWYGRGDFVCLDIDTGNEIWRTPSRGMIPGSPLFLKNFNRVISGSNDFHVYILEATNGNIISKIPTKGEVKGLPATNGSESIIVTQTIYGYVYAFTPNGQVIWSRRVGLDSVHSYPLIWDELVYVTNNANHVLCLCLHTGDIKWVCNLRASVGWGVNKIDNYLLATTMSGHIVIIDRYTGHKLASDTLTKIPLLEEVITYQPSAYDGKNLVTVTNNKGIICHKVDLHEIIGH